MKQYRILKRAIVTEKSTSKDESNKYAFEVDRRANKIEIGKAVGALFKVRVTEVHVMNVRGKKKRVGKIVGRKPDWKKAIVTLAPTDTIEILKGV